MDRSNLCPFCARNAGQTIQLFLLDDGTDHNRQLRQLHELLKTAIQFLDMRSSGSEDGVPGSFEKLIDFLNSLENDETINRLINLEILRNIASHIVSTNANITQLLKELKNRKKRDSTLQNELKHVQKLKQPKNRIHGAECVYSTSGSWVVEDSN